MLPLPPSGLAFSVSRPMNGLVGEASSFTRLPSFAYPGARWGAAR
jgi:hypothetical protein